MAGSSQQELTIMYRATCTSGPSRETLNHCPPTIPGRAEHYEYAMHACKRYDDAVQAQRNADEEYTMAQQYTIKMIQRRIERVNEMLGFPQVIRDENNKATKAYHIASGYGGWRLEQGDGARDVFQAGFMSKRVLFELVCAFQNGIDVGRENN